MNKKSDDRLTGDISDQKENQTPNKRANPAVVSPEQAEALSKLAALKKKSDIVRLQMTDPQKKALASQIQSIETMLKPGSKTSPRAALAPINEIDKKLSSSELMQAVRDLREDGKKLAVSRDVKEYSKLARDWLAKYQQFKQKYHVREGSLSNFEELEKIQREIDVTAREMGRVLNAQREREKAMPKRSNIHAEVQSTSVVEQAVDIESTQKRTAEVEIKAMVDAKDVLVRESQDILKRLKSSKADLSSDVAAWEEKFYDWQIEHMGNLRGEKLGEFFKADEVLKERLNLLNNKAKQSAEKRSVAEQKMAMGDEAALLINESDDILQKMESTDSDMFDEIEEWTEKYTAWQKKYQEVIRPENLDRFQKVDAILKQREKLLGKKSFEMLNRQFEKEEQHERRSKEALVRTSLEDKASEYLSSIEFMGGFTADLKKLKEELGSPSESQVEKIAKDWKRMAGLRAEQLDNMILKSGGTALFNADMEKLKSMINKGSASAEFNQYLSQLEKAVALFSVMRKVMDDDPKLKGRENPLRQEFLGISVRRLSDPDLTMKIHYKALESFNQKLLKWQEFDAATEKTFSQIQVLNAAFPGLTTVNQRSLIDDIKSLGEISDENASDLNRFSEIPQAMAEKVTPDRAKAVVKDMKESLKQLDMPARKNLTGKLSGIEKQMNEKTSWVDCVQQLAKLHDEIQHAPKKSESKLESVAKSARGHLPNKPDLSAVGSKMKSKFDSLRRKGGSPEPAQEAKEPSATGVKVPKPLQRLLRTKDQEGPGPSAADRTLDQTSNPKKG